MNSTIKNIIIFVVVFILAIVGYQMFFAKDQSSEGLLTSGTPGVETTTDGTASSVGGEFISTLLNINNLKLDNSLFSSSTFMSLQDFTINLIPEVNPGRSNPFAPIGSDISTPAQSSTPSTPAPTTPVSTTPSTPTAGSTTGSGTVR
ncbi:MAG: hypothetical protein WC795_01155 [Candidatus Paceibacterota bacterium]|jgi:hypothetical protein